MYQSGLFVHLFSIIEEHNHQTRDRNRLILGNFVWTITEIFCIISQLALKNVIDKEVHVKLI